jgi:hypothetical protein
MMSNGGGLKIM